MKKRIAAFLLAVVICLTPPVGELYGSDLEIEPAEVSEDRGEPEEIHWEEEPLVSEEIPEDISGEELEAGNPGEEAEEPENGEGPAAPEASVDHEEPGSTDMQQWGETIPEEYTGTIFTDGNAELLTADTPEGEEVLEEIEQGEILAFAPASLADLGEEEEPDAKTAEEASVSRLAANRYRLIATSTIADCDEIWTASSAIHTRVRYIEYVDSDGNVKRSPLYCLNASKMGINNTGSSGLDLKPEAVKFFSNSTIRKLLYFGYGGPGDICDSYDPSCSHVRWSRWQNRYVFTHQALSKIYANDVNGATQAQIEHVGLVRFINKIKSLTIPDRSAVRIRAVNTSGNSVTANPLNIGMILYRTRPSSNFSWLESTFQNGFQITPLCTVVDSAKAGNGITVSRGSKDVWQLVYWTSEALAKSRPNNPSRLEKGKSVNLKNGYCFRIVYPKNTTGSRRFSWKMLLRPVKYILVDGSVQTGMNIQDFGAFVYQGSRGLMQLNLTFQPTGSILLQKTSSQTGKPVGNAVYTLYAGQDLYSGGTRIYAKNARITEGTTNAKGQIVFDSLVPGKYYVKEKTASPGYLLNVSSASCTVAAGKQVTVNVKETPDIKGQVSVEKVAEETGIHLAGAEFTLYTWNKNTAGYEAGEILAYDQEQKRYISGTLVYSDVNQGKFKIVETKNPPGYTGSWTQELVLTEPGTNKRFTFRAENIPLKEYQVEIRKLDSVSGNILEGAEFHLYEWNKTAGAYGTEGTPFTYEAESGIYKSEILEATQENQGRFLVRETKNPEGYQGSWSQEIDLMDPNVQLQFSVENQPIPKKFGRVHLRKKDAVTGEELEGAEFQAFAWNREEGRYQEVPENREFVFQEEEQIYVCTELELTQENQGRFLIRETKVPEGYKGEWQKEIVFSEDGELLELEAENDPIRLPTGQISVIKKIQESEITWAHGNPTFSFVITGTDLRGNKRAYEDCVVFTPGGYETDGEGWAALKTTISDIPLGNYKVYEKPVLRYYLEKAEPGTANVQIITGREPAYGTPPVETAYGRADLGIENKNASLTFYNRKKRYDDYSHNSFVENTVPLIKPDK